MPEHRHLRRLDHIWASYPRYFITVCTLDRKKMLAFERVVKIMREEWSASLLHRGWAVGSYCVMPDHVHFFCTDTESKTPLHTFIGKWKEWTAKRIGKEKKGQGSVWQPEFFDHLLRSDESYSEKWDYVWRNPVRAGLVEAPEQWPYSGYVHYK